MKLYILFWSVYKWTIVTYGMEVRTQVSTTCDWSFAFTTPLMHRYNGQKKMWRTWKISRDFYTPRNEVSGRILDSPCPSVCPLTFRVRPVASTVQNGFFLYLVQMINSMRGCVACDDPWPWPLSSRSFGLDLENRVRSAASIVLDGFVLYMAQMITIIRGVSRVTFFFRNLEILIFSKFF